MGKITTTIQTEKKKYKKRKINNDEYNYRGFRFKRLHVRVILLEAYTVLILELHVRYSN